MVSRLTSDSIGHCIKKIKRGIPITAQGISISYGPTVARDLRAGNWGPLTHVKDAFTYRKYLVKLSFAQKNFVVSIQNTEASSSEEAIEIAAQRATLAHLVEGVKLGNLMSFDVAEDTPENRAKFGVNGGEVRVEYHPHKQAA